MVDGIHIIKKNSLSSRIKEDFLNNIHPANIKFDVFKLLKLHSMGFT